MNNEKRIELVFEAIRAAVIVSLVIVAACILS